MRDFYGEINKVLTDYETKGRSDKNVDWAANRIDWCWKWKKITKEQMEELADRATKIFKGDY